MERDGGMKVTYIHHSSFSVELEHTVLLFDYFAGELPSFPAGKRLVVFVSHFHGDHFSPVIFEKMGKRPGVQFVLSDDINRKKVPESCLGQVRFVKAGEKFILESLPELTIETFRSTDSGVAFWISCEGAQIYHAGDLNNWWWEGEDKAWNHNMAANYKREIEKMAGRRADAAFIPLDPRLEQWFYLGMAQFMEQVDAKAVFPMHFWEDYTVIEKMKAHPASEGFRERLISITREGEEFTL